MPTLLYTHAIFLEHEMGPHHPERPDRLRAVQRALESEEFVFLTHAEAPRADPRIAELVHPAWYVEDLLENVPTSGYRHLDPDTAVGRATGEAALHALGAVTDAVTQVMTGKARNAFCAVRPPGHHAEPEHAMGFCFFANAAIGALYAARRHGARRVAVVDFDVHHGNGTQAVFDRYNYLFYASSHQSPAYPGTGRERERGLHNNFCNVELPPGSGTELFRQRYTETILPKVREWNPDLLMISAGFDAHARDPLAYLRLKGGDFEWVTRELVQVADECCNGRVVSVLEGGYDLQGLAEGVAGHVRALLG